MTLLRKAIAADVPFLMNLVKELALFEKAPHEVINTEEQMLADGFGPNPCFEAIVAENDTGIIGMSLYYFSYSTWKGRSMYIDDLIVLPAYRNQGIGTLLLKETMRTARDEKVGKLHWQVLDWNEPAIAYYKKFGATFDAEWINCSVSAKDLNNIT